MLSCLSSPTLAGRVHRRSTMVRDIDTDAAVMILHPFYCPYAGTKAWICWVGLAIYDNSMTRSSVHAGSCWLKGWR
jgi:hypothetical protein